MTVLLKFVPFILIQTLLKTVVAVVKDFAQHKIFSSRAWNRRTSATIFVSKCKPRHPSA